MIFIPVAERVLCNAGYKTEEKPILGRRLGKYKYYDMDQVIAAALELTKREL